MSATARSAARRCWTLVRGELALDVEVLATDTATVREVVGVLPPELRRGADEGLWSGPTRLPADLPLSAVELGHGAVLRLGGPAVAEAADGPPSALELQVVGGPDAGRSAALVQGAHVVGRSPGSPVHLTDPGVSRRHVQLRVGEGQVRVTDLRSSNGSTLAEAELTAAPHAWPIGERLRIGATALALAGPGDAPAALEPGQGGRRQLRVPVRLPVPAHAVEIAFPAPPAPPPARRPAWLAVALPAVGGGVLAWVLDTPTFLFFALLGPLVALAGWWSERRWGRRTHRREIAEHARRRAAAEEQVDRSVRAAVRGLERRCPDLAALANAARRLTSVVWCRRAPDADALAVRLGTGPGPTGVLRRDPDGSRVAQQAPHLPVCADLRQGGLAVVGPRDRTSGVLRSVVAQVAALHAPDVVELLLLTATPCLPDWRWTRWLPHLLPGAVTVLDARGAEPTDTDALARRLEALVARRGRTQRTGDDSAAWSGPWVVVVVDGPIPASLAAVLRAGVPAGVVVLTSATTLSGVPVATGTVVQVAGETGALAVVRTGGAPPRDDVVLDQLPSDVAGRLARDLAGLAPAVRSATVPTRVRGLDLPAPGLSVEPDGDLSGDWSRARDTLVAPLGAGADGPVAIDLCRSGPHALVAGTTGSGKSELLRTLIAGLALAHPPDRCSFLLVDYKGGAAFAEAAALPHTVGLLTDLDGPGTARALRSLTAELVRREALLAQHGVADICALPTTVALARLVIVVDEFATLAEELPSFVPGLVGIAQRGRSLGVHLVLATQRPAGVVSPEIRANCTLRICLRTTDEADSRDVLGGPGAAHLPVEVPGRAWLRTGTGEPQLLQVARVSEPWSSADEPTVAVGPWSWPVALPAWRPRPDGEGTSDLGTVVAALRRHAETLDLPRPHRPWRPPLPHRLDLEQLARLQRPPAGTGDVLLGLVDRPDQQDQQVLAMDLDDAGTWLAVGGPRSGRSTFLRNVLRQAAARRGPDRLHVHVVDLGGGALAAEASALPQVGTVVGGPDALRIVRLVDRLAEEIAARRSGVAAPDAPPLLLLVDGVESVCTLLDDSDPGNGSPALLRLLRDGAAAGLTGVLSGDRAIPGGRLAAVARHRLVLPLADRADYAVAGVPLSAVPTVRPPGRALVDEQAAECQLVLPPPSPAPSPPVPAGGPLRVVELPPDPELEPCSTRPSGAAALPVTVGPGGDEGALLSVDLLRTGGLLVVGPAGSGRSTAIAALVGDLVAAGVPVLDVRSVTGAGSDTAAVTAWLAANSGRPAAVCIDDLGSPAQEPALAALPPLGATSGVVLLAGGHGGQLATWFQGPVATLRRARSGLLLTPVPGDAEVLGLRLPRTPVPGRPGSGWLVVDGSPVRVQVARRRPGVDDRRQVSSSSGPISCVAYQASS